MGHQKRKPEGQRIVGNGDETEIKKIKSEADGKRNVPRYI